MEQVGSPPYFEVCADRSFSITHEGEASDPQWDGHEHPAHMKVFADLDAYPIELLWLLRCAWFNFDGSTAEDAEEDVLKIAEAARSAISGS